MRRLAAVATAAVGLVLLAACAGSSESTAPTSPPVNPPAASTPASTPGTVELDVTVADGQVAPAPSNVDVPLGATVVLTVTSDVADELHVHGYDVEKELPAGETVTLELTADQAGTFEVETHESELLLLKLVVS